MIDLVGKDSNSPKTISEGSQRFFDLMELAAGKRPASGYSLLKDRIFSLNKRVTQKRFTSCHGGHCGGLGVKNVVKKVEVISSPNPSLDKDSRITKNKTLNSKKVINGIVNCEVTSVENMSAKNDPTGDSYSNEWSLTLKLDELSAAPETLTQEVKSDSQSEEKYANHQNINPADIPPRRSISPPANKSEVNREKKPEESDDKENGNLQNEVCELQTNTASKTTPALDVREQKNIVSPKPKEPAVCCPCLEKEIHYYYSYSRRKRKRRGTDTSSEAELPASKAKLRLRENEDEFEEVEMDQLHNYLSLDYADFFNLHKGETDQLDTASSVENKNDLLLQSVKDDDLRAVEEILDSSADPNFVHDNNGTTVLHTACNLASLQIVQALTSAGSNLEASDHTGKTALHVAAAAGREDVAMHLALSGVDINAANGYGVRALELALVHGHVSTAQILLKLGADPLKENLMGESAEALAESLGYPPLRLIRDRKKHCTSCASCAKKQAKSLPLVVKLIQSIEQDKPHSVRDYLKKGAPISMRLPSALYWPGNATLLHYAARLGKDEVIKELIAAGGNPKAQDIAGNTPVHAAAQSGKQETVELLLEAGAEFEATTQAGTTPLHSAAATGSGEVVNILLQKGASPLAEDYKGRTPADWARRKGFVTLSQSLQFRRFSSGTLLREEDEKREMQMADLEEAIKSNFEMEWASTISA